MAHSVSPWMSGVLFLLLHDILCTITPFFITEDIMIIVDRISQHCFLKLTGSETCTDAYQITSLTNVIYSLPSINGIRPFSIRNWAVYSDVFVANWSGFQTWLVRDVTASYIRHQNLLKGRYPTFGLRSCIWHGITIAREILSRALIHSPCKSAALACLRVCGICLRRKLTYSNKRYLFQTSSIHIRMHISMLFGAQNTTKT